MKEFKKISTYVLSLFLVLIIKTSINRFYARGTFDFRGFFYMFFIFFIYSSIPITLSILAVNHINVLNRKKISQQLIVGIIIGIGLYLYYYVTIAMGNELLNIDQKWFVFVESIVLGICLVFISNKLIIKD